MRNNQGIQQLNYKSPPTIWWRLIVLVLSIFIIIQQFNDVNALQSPIFI